MDSNCLTKTKNLSSRNEVIVTSGRLKLYDHKTNYYICYKTNYYILHITGIIDKIDE